MTTTDDREVSHTASTIVTSGGVSPVFDSTDFILQLDGQTVVVNAAVAQSILRGLLQHAAVTLPGVK